MNEVTREEFIALEKRVAAVEHKVSPEARLESGKIAFSGADSSAAPYIIPNGPDEVPNVGFAQIEKLAYAKFQNGTRKWIALTGRKDWGFHYADLFPWSERDNETLWNQCRRVHDPNTFKTGPFKPLPLGTVFEVKAWNPGAPIKPGCHAEEWELVPDK